MFWMIVKHTALLGFLVATVCGVVSTHADKWEKATHISLGVGISCLMVMIAIEGGKALPSIISGAGRMIERIIGYHPKVGGVLFVLGLMITILLGGAEAPTIWHNIIAGAIGLSAMGAGGTMMKAWI